MVLFYSFYEQISTDDDDDNGIVINGNVND